MFSFISGHQRPTDNITLYTANPAYSKPTDLDIFKLDGIEYMRKSVVAKNSKKRKKGSSIWSNGEPLVRQTDSKEVFYCYICESSKRSQQLPILNGTRGGIDHLELVHRLDRDGNPLGPIQKASDQQLVNFSTVVKTYDFDVFKRLLIRWLVHCQLAISMVENIYFRELVIWLNKGIGELLPAAKATVRSWIIEEWNKQKELVQKDLADALSSIHLSFDLWTSPNYYSIISIIAHFIDKEGARKQRLLAFRVLRGAHSGENQAGVVLEVIEEYSIGQQIGYFMTDNAQSNDVCIDLVLRQLYPRLTAEQRAARRLRCFGHITNLCARALLLGKGAGKAMDEAEANLRRGAFDALEKFWRQRGAIGRLHNIVRYIRTTPQRMEEFANIKKGGELAQFDNLEVSGERLIKPSLFNLWRHIKLVMATRSLSCYIALYMARQRCAIPSLIWRDAKQAAKPPCLARHAPVLL